MLEKTTKSKFQTLWRTQILWKNRIRNYLCKAIFW